MGAEIVGNLTVVILEARKLQGPRQVEKPHSGFFLQLEIGEIREITATKEAHELKFEEQFEFIGTSSRVPMVLRALCKTAHGAEAVNVGSVVINFERWNGETRWVCLENGGVMAGEVLLSADFVRGAVELKKPFQIVADIAERTGNLVAPADPYIERGLEMTSSLLDVLLQSKIVTSAFYYFSKLERRHIVALLAANGSILMPALGTIALCVTIPALLFFPVTIFLSVTSAMIFAMTAMVLMPVGICVVWLLMCSHPIQKRYVRPTFHKCLNNDTVSRLMIKSS
jgi:hypothetical protein